MRSAQIIHEARRRAGLTQAALAVRIGTSQPAIARWEAGRASPPMERLLDVAHACGLDLQLRLVDRDEHDLDLAAGNLRLTPAARLGQLVEMASFAERAGRAARRSRGQAVAESPRGAVFRPEAILSALEMAGVEYVLIGGLAAVFHGSPHFTRDVDICPARTPSNLRSLADALAQLDARLRIGAGDAAIALPHDATFLAAVEILNTTTRDGDLDIAFEPTGTQGYPDLRRDAETIDLDGTQVPVASLADVIRSKEAAGRPKDTAVLSTLRALEAGDRSP